MEDLDSLNVRKMATVPEVPIPIPIPVPFRKRTGSAMSGFYSGELAMAGKAAWDFICGIIQKYNLKREDGYHTENRCISLADVTINEDTHGHFSDNMITQILDGHGEVVAFSYISRNDMNCAEVIMVDLLKEK